MFDLHTVQMPDGAGPQLLDRLFMASVAGLTVAAAAASLGSIGAITAGTGYTQAPTIAPTGGTVTAGALGKAAQVHVTSMKAVGTPAVVAPGTGWVPGDTITQAGGTLAYAPAAGAATVLTVADTQVVSAIINNAGSGGTNGPVTITGTTGTGTKFQATGTIVGGVLTGPLVVSVGGAYTVNPTALTGEPITGGSLTGATVNLVMGVQAVTVSTAGAYQTCPTNPVGVGSTTSVAGTGATFTTGYGINTAEVDDSGNYSVIPTGFSVTSVDGNGSSGAIAAGAAVAAGAPAFVQIGPFANDGLPPNAAYQVFATANQDCVVEIQTKQPSFASLKIQPRLAANSVLAGTVDAIIVG